MAIGVSLHTDNETINQLKHDWQTLQENSMADSLFISWEWISLWWKHYQTANDTLWILLAHDQNNLVGIAPLMIITHHESGHISWRQLEFIGAHAPFDHWDFIIQQGYETAVLDKFFAYIKTHHNKWDVLSLSNMLPSSKTIDYLESTSIQWELEEGHITPYIQLSSDFDSYFSSLSSNKRQKQRRYIRNLAKTFPDWSFNRATSDDVMTVLEELVQHHQSKWEALDSTGAFGNSKDLEFHRDVVQQFSLLGYVVLYQLILDEERAGIFYMFTYRERMSFYSSGINPKYKQWDPGHIMHQLAIEDAIASGFTEYDFMWGDEHYKYSWKAEKRVDRTFKWYASLKGKMLHQTVEIARKAKQALKDRQSTTDEDSNTQ